MIAGAILIGIFVVCLASTGIVSYLYFVERKRNAMVVEKIGKIDLKPIEDKVNKIREEENKYFARLFEMEMLLENYRKGAFIIGNKVEDLEKRFKAVEGLPKDYEMTYRDVVRKLLELDNKFTDKFKMLAEVVLQLKGERK